MTWRPSGRQTLVLDALTEGLTNDEIAARLGISADGVKWHVSELLGRTGLPNRYALAEWWRQRQQRGRAGLAAFPASLRFGLVAGMAAVIALAVLAGGLLRGGEEDGPVETLPDAQADTGDQGVPRAATTTAQPPPIEGGKPFFAVRQLDYAGTPTVRISGADLPRAVTVPAIEFAIACANAAWNGLACSAGVERQGLAEPDAGLPRYRLDFVYLDADYDVPNEWFWYGGREVPSHQYWYVPSEPAVAGPLPDYGWVELGKPVADLIERYAGLARDGLIGEAPTLQEGLAASFDYIEGRVSVGKPGGGGELTALPDEQGGVLAGLLGLLEPVIVVLEGGLIGQRSIETVPIQLAFGDETVAFWYLPPGAIAADGMIVASQDALSSWQMAGPRYAKHAFAAPEALEALMADLGFPGGPLDEGLRSTVIRPEPERRRFISRIEIWREGDDDRLVVPPPERQPCPEGCDLEYPGREPAGEHFKVAIWPTGAQPFPDLVSPARFDYYPDDGTGRGVLVQTNCPAVAGGHCSQFIDFSFYPPPAVDAALQEAARRLQ